MQLFTRLLWLLAMLTAIILTPSAAAQASAEPAAVVANAAVLDPPDLGAGVRLGGFSGLVTLDPAQGVFLTVTDRGPDAVDHGRSLAPEMTYQPSIVKLQLQAAGVQVVQQTPLAWAPPSGPVPVAEVDPAARARRDDLDPEGLAYDPRDGSFWICDEDGPSLLRVAPDGSVQFRLAPLGSKAGGPDEELRELLPRELSRHLANRGFEDVSLSPDGTTLFAMMESPLAIPDKDVGERSRLVRLVTLDVTDSSAPKLSGMYVYQTAAAAKPRDQGDITVNGLAALSVNRALVLERDAGAAGSHRMVYEIDLTTATNLIDRPGGKVKGLEAMSDDDLLAAEIAVAEKQPLVDLAELGLGAFKAEGLAAVDSQTLAVVNDNDFGLKGFDPAGQAIPTGVESRLVLVRLGRTLW